MINKSALAAVNRQKDIDEISISYTIGNVKTNIRVRPSDVNHYFISLKNDGCTNIYVLHYYDKLGRMIK